MFTGLRQALALRPGAIGLEGFKKMAESIRAVPAACKQCGHSTQGLLRMSIVIGASIASLVALPGWLRSLDEAHHFSDSLQHASALEIDAPAAQPLAASAPAAVKDQIRHQMLADFLAKRYRVSKDALERFISLAYVAGQMTKVDPLLILAVMAVESSFNPIAESVVGAKGLMQIIPEYHKDKLKSPHGAELNVLDPETNIIAGAKVLREYATKTGEDLAAALRLYGGTGSSENAYSSKVLSERERLEQIVRRAQERKLEQLAGPARQI